VGDEKLLIVFWIFRVIEEKKRMLGLLGILLGVAAFIGFEIFQQRADERAINKGLQLANQEIFNRQDKLGEQALANLREQELVNLREQELVAKYRYQQQLAANLFHKISVDRLEGLDDITEVEQQLGSAEGEEYTFLTQKREALEEYVKVLELGMERYQEIMSCDATTVEGREKLDNLLSRSGVPLEETARNLGVAP
jgi:hypothetical protein